MSESTAAPTATRAHADRRQWAWRIVIALLALAWMTDLVRVWRITNFHDLDVLILAATRAASGGDIYADAPAFQAAIESGTFSMRDETVVWPYAYPPLLAVALIPATWLPYGLVQAVWWGLSAIALLLGGWLTLRSVGAATPPSVALLLVLLYRFQPAVVTLRLGQIELLQLALLAVALYALSRGRERAAGLALGVATGIKLFPGALIGLLLWRRRWRAALWALATTVVCIAGPALAAGFRLDEYLEYASIYGIGGAFAAFPLNHSLNGFYSRNLIHNVFSATLKGVHLPVLARALTLLSSGAIVLASAWLTWHSHRWSPENDEDRFALEYGLGVAALLLVSPHSQVYAFVWALIPLMILAGWLLRSAPSLSEWLALGAIYLLISRDYCLFYPGLTRIFQTHKTRGAQMLWSLFALILWRARRGQVPAVGGR